MDGPGEKEEGHTGLKMKIQLLDAQTIMPSLGASKHRPLLTYHGEELASKALSIWFCLWFCRLLLTPGFVPCPEEDSPPWGTKPVPQDSGGQPGIQRTSILG
jgi:hypothetical protein